MTAELVLSALQPSDDARGDIAGIAVTDQMIVAVGGSTSPIVVASSDGRHFEPRTIPRSSGLRDALAVGDSLWVCGEQGLLAVSRDHGAHWQSLEPGTTGCLHALALGADGAIWVVGDAGHAARVLGEQPRRVDVGVAARLASVHAVRDEVVFLGDDGTLLRWREGKVAVVACGATRPLTSLAVTARGTWVVVGHGGFIARSPDGTWYSRVNAGVGDDLEAIGALPDGSLAIVGDRGRVLVSADDARTWRAVAHELGQVHLWSIERFGGGALIGGDGGLIARLAAPGDATWRERGLAVSVEAIEPATAADGAADDGTDDDGAADDGAGDRGERPSGWDAIDHALAPIYGDIEPLHYGTVRPYEFGGDDPIPGISVYARVDPAPHWHFVTYGFTELFRKESDDLQESGFGFELTLRLCRALDDTQPPTWALNFLQNLARYVFSTGNAFAAGHKMGLNGPIALEHTTQITAVCFADDPELGDIESQFGRARFVQVVGITDDEYRMIQEWSTGGLVEILAQRIPFLLTDLARGSVLDDPATAALVRERIDREGSSEDLTFAGDLTLGSEGGQITIELGALYAATLPRAMRGRIRHHRDYELRGREATLRIEPSDVLGYRLEGNDLVLEVTQELAQEIEAALRESVAGTYRFTTWPRLTIIITPSIIRGQDGSITDVRGAADPEEARRIIAEEHARRAAAAQEGADEPGNGHSDEDDVDADADVVWAEPDAPVDDDSDDDAGDDAADDDDDDDDDADDAWADADAGDAAGEDDAGDGEDDADDDEGDDEAIAADDEAAAADHEAGGDDKGEAGDAMSAAHRGDDGPGGSDDDGRVN